MSKLSRVFLWISVLFYPLFFCVCSARRPQEHLSSIGVESTNDSALSLPEKIENELSSYPSLSENSSSESSDLPTTSDVWDVSMVDISKIDRTKKLIAFTFDDSPSRTLENIFAVFADFNENNPDCVASSTVFFNGYLFDESTPHLLHAACALGFELGNHTYSHYDLTTLTSDVLRIEIDKTDKLLRSVDKKERHLLRAPFGKTNEAVKKAAATPIIDWSIDTLDWTGVSADEIYDRVFSHRYSGAIVLMHDGYEATVDALKRLLPDLKADGYQVVNVSQLIRAHGCIFKRGGVYIQAKKH